MIKINDSNLADIPTNRRDTAQTNNWKIIKKRKKHDIFHFDWFREILSF